MRQLVYIKPGVVEWQDAPACDVDVALPRGTRAVRRPFPFGRAASTPKQ